MSKLDELIKEYCRGGVEHKPIGDVVDYEQPSKYIVKNTKYDDAYSIPVLTAGQSFVLGYTNEQDGIYPASKDNPVIIFDDFTASFKWVDFPFKVKSSAMKILTAKNNISVLRYIFHAMGDINFSSSEHKRLWIGIYSNFKIPLPPLPVQEEIVRILDLYNTKKTELILNLTKEQNFRNKQYKTYRDKLLAFDASVAKPMKIGDICVKVTSGGTPSSSNSDYYGGDIPWLRTQEVDWVDIKDTGVKITNSGLINSSAKWIPENCVIVAMYGATAAKVAINKIPLTTNQACCNLQINDDIALYKYVFHYLCSQYDNLKSLGRGSQSNINADIIKNYIIPVPSLDIQKRIVDTLDNFDKICTDLNIGLPAEIEARQKEYEFYRNALLSFDRLSGERRAESGERRAESGERA